MTNHDAARCPSCDTANPAHAAFCSNCGRPVSAVAAAAPAGAGLSATGGGDSGMKGYMIGALAVAAVLIVGGALVFLADGDERNNTAGSDSIASTQPSTAPTTVADEAVVPVSEPPPEPPTTESPETVAPTVAPTDPPTTPAPVPAPTAAPAPVQTAAPTPAPSSALTAAEAENFFRGYIATAASGDHAGAWNMLSPSDQADYTNGGFDQFVGFWLSVSFANVDRVQSVASGVGFQSLVIDMAYGQADGGATSFEVIEADINVRPDGSLQIFDYRYIRNQ